MIMLRIAALLAAAVITACAVGPDFKSPDAPAKLAHYTATPLAIEQPDAPVVKQY